MTQLEDTWSICQPFVLFYGHNIPPLQHPLEQPGLEPVHATWNFGLRDERVVRNQTQINAREEDIVLSLASQIIEIMNSHFKISTKKLKIKKEEKR